MPMSHPPRWHDAAAAASFVPYELVLPVPLTRRPGGLGYSDFTTVCNLDLEFEAAGSEIEITTRLRDERLGASYRQLLTTQVLAALSPWELELPVTVRIEQLDREVLVDGEPVIFQGVAIVEHGIWSGWSMLPSCIVQINVRRTNPGNLAIAACRDVGSIVDTR